MKIAQRENAIIGRIGLRMHSAVFSAGMMVIGWKLLQPDHTFASAVIYRVIATYADEETWGAGFLVFGGLRLVMIGLAFARQDDPWPLRISCALSFCSACLWAGCAVLFYQANPPGISSYLWSIIAIAESVTCVMLGMMVGTVRRRLLIHAGRAHP
jgi:hypothetical protein